LKARRHRKRDRGKDNLFARREILELRRACQQLTRRIFGNEDDGDADGRVEVALWRQANAKGAAIANLEQAINANHVPENKIRAARAVTSGYCRL
jgi:hypothetical protein